MANKHYVSFGRPADVAYFSVAPYGTTLPETSTDELDSAFSSLLVSEDGVTPSNDYGKDDSLVDWAGHTILAAVANPEATVEVPIIDNSEAAHKILYGTSNVDDTTGATFSGSTDTWSLVITELHNDEDGEAVRVVRYVYPQAVPNEWDESSHARADVITHTVTFLALYDETYGGYFRELPAVAASSTTTTTESEES